MLKILVKKIKCCKRKKEEEHEREKGRGTDLLMAIGEADVQQLHSERQRAGTYFYTAKLN